MIYVYATLGVLSSSAIVGNIVGIWVNIRSLVVFRLHWEYLKICAIIRAINICPVIRNMDVFAGVRSTVKSVPTSVNHTNFPLS